MSDFSLKNFDQNFPKEIRDLFLTISREGFALCLVGGAVRDFLIDQNISRDLDFELRHKFEFTSQEWSSKISNLSKRLKDIYKYDVEVLKFNIFRIRIGEFEVEISSPRVEKFSNTSESLGHSDFSAHFSSVFSYRESFQRRDFTINAIGIEFGVTGSEDEFKLIDPFNGVKDIQSKILRPVSDVFYKDPVRYLRALRFKEYLGFELSRDLKDDIVYFNLEKLSIHYFLQEGKKSGLGNLARSMIFSKRKFSVKLPPWARLFESLDYCSAKDTKLIREFLFLSGKDLSLTDFLELTKDLKIKKSVGVSLYNLLRALEIDLNELINNSKKETFNSISDAYEYELLLKICGKDEILDSLPCVEFDDRLKQIVLNTLNGSEEFDDLVLTTAPKLRSSLGIYCHLRHS